MNVIAAILAFVLLAGDVGLVQLFYDCVYDVRLGAAAVEIAVNARPTSRLC
jgi:hypothetical protein